MGEGEKDYLTTSHNTQRPLVPGLMGVTGSLNTTPREATECTKPAADAAFRAISFSLADTQRRAVQVERYAAIHHPDAMAEDDAGRIHPTEMRKDATGTRSVPAASCPCRLLLRLRLHLHRFRIPANRRSLFQARQAKQCSPGRTIAKRGILNWFLPRPHA